MSKMADKSTHNDAVNHTALTVARVRGLVARAVWIACLVLALIMAAAAFSYALDANDENDLVQLIRDLADTVDLYVFDLDNPVKEFDPPNSAVKNALFNYGICAVIYLILGRFLERIIRP
jgi:hypothetical protein